MSPPVLEDRLIAAVLPGSAWLAVLTCHVEWAVTSSDELSVEERGRVARQLAILLAAAAEGASPAQDDLVTEVRQLVDAAYEMLGHTPDNADIRLAAQLVYRHETMQSLVTKLANAAGISPTPRST